MLYICVCRAYWREQCRLRHIIMSIMRLGRTNLVFDPLKENYRYSIFHAT